MNDGNRQHNWENTPLYKKAKEVYEIVCVMIDFVDEESLHDKPHVQLAIKDLQSNSLIILSKIAGAHHVELYDLLMEHATIIRKAAREMFVTAGSLQREQIGDKDYARLLRTIIEEEFRPEFAEWVAGFDEWNYIIDRWGLFNPPGINWDDKDPDDDLPFDNPLNDL